MLLAGLGVLGMCVIAGMLLFRPTDRGRAPVVSVAPEVVAVTVTSIRWTHTTHVDRRRLVDHEGFAEAEPPDALDVTQDGARHHSDDQVLDGTTTETYFEDVPYQDTQTVMQDVPCGQDCTTTTPVCHEVCSDEGNGFATCHDECTGGGTTCTPKTCSQPVTQTVTRTRQEPRTRQVPHFISVPHNAPWFHWRTWDWVHDRDVVREGTTDPPTWPSDSDLAPDASLVGGETEHPTREEEYDVTARDTRGRTIAIHLFDESAFLPWHVGATGRVRVEGPEGDFISVVEAPSAAQQAVDGGS